MKILFIACILSGFKETIVEILINHNYKESSARWIGTCIGISPDCFFKYVFVIIWLDGEEIEIKRWRNEGYFK